MHRLLVTFDTTEKDPELDELCGYIERKLSGRTIGGVDLDDVSVKVLSEGEGAAFGGGALAEGARVLGDKVREDEEK